MKLCEGQETRSSARRLAPAATRVGGREASAEPGSCVKHRSAVTAGDISAGRISCTPQKLQEMFAGVKIGRGHCVRSGKRVGRNGSHSAVWSRSGQRLEQGETCADRRRCTSREQRFSRGVQAGWRGRTGSRCVPAGPGARGEAVQADGSDGALAGGCCWAASIRNDFGVQPNSSLNSRLK